MPAPWRNNPAARPSSVVDATACVTALLAAVACSRALVASATSALAARSLRLRACAPGGIGHAHPCQRPWPEGTQVERRAVASARAAAMLVAKVTGHPAKGGDQQDTRRLISSSRCLAT